MCVLQIKARGSFFYIFESLKQILLWICRLMTIMSLHIIVIMTIMTIYSHYVTHYDIIAIIRSTDSL